MVGPFQASRFASGVDRQLVTVDAYDGDSGALRWTVTNARFGGSDRAVLEQVQRACGMPMLEGSYWQGRQHFRGLMHFDCQLDVDQMMERYLTFGWRLHDCV